MRAVIQRWIICLCGGMLFSFAEAQVVQRGVVLEMNSGNRPLAGVEIRATGAAPSDSDQEWQFVLSFVSSLPGDPLLLDGVYKKGFEMVNREKVDNWNLSSDAVLKIVLGRTEMIDALRKKYYQIGVSASEREYHAALVELETRRKLQRLTDEEYVRRVDSLSQVQVTLKRRLEVYAMRFARLNRDELERTEQQALELLDKGDMEGAIRLYESMHTDSVLAQRVAGRQAADADVQLLLPSLVHSFELMRQMGDVAGCDSVGHLILEATREMAPRLTVTEWMWNSGKKEAAIDRYGLLVREAQTVAEVEQIEVSLQRCRQDLKWPKKIKEKLKLLEERILARRNWARIKENSWKNEK